MSSFQTTSTVTLWFSGLLGFVSEMMESWQASSLEDCLDIITQLPQSTAVSTEIFSQGTS